MPLPKEVHEFWRDHYGRPFMESVELFSLRFPERKASLDLPLFLYTFAPDDELVDLELIEADAGMAS